MNAQAMLADARGLCALNVEPESLRQRAGARGDDGRNSWSPFRLGWCPGYADVLLPISPFTETAGTFVKPEGRAQSSAAVSVGVRVRRKVLCSATYRVLGFDYDSSEQVTAAA